MKFKLGSVNERMMDLLDVSQDMREDKWLAIQAYKTHNWDHFACEETIGRSWRCVQQHFPHLRGKGWEDRQRYTVCIGRRIRDKKGPDDLSHQFQSPKEWDDLWQPVDTDKVMNKYGKESIFSFIIRKLF